MSMQAQDSQASLDEFRAYNGEQICGVVTVETGAPCRKPALAGVGVCCEHLGRDSE